MRTKKQKIDAGKLLFSNHDLKVLLIPLMVEQLLNSLMGTVDSMMVSNVGSAAISAVSLVDSINVLVIQVFTALTAGGAYRYGTDRGTAAAGSGTGCKSKCSGRRH